MTLGNRISYHRKKLGLTQEALAKQLDVTNQAVSKWEADLCCPDVMLLPKIADIFGITVDELFGRERQAEPEPEQAEAGKKAPKKQGFTIDFGSLFGTKIHLGYQDVKVTDGSLPWDDDGVLRAVVFVGRTLMAHHAGAKDFTFTYEGPALDVDSAFSIVCGDIAGNADAGTSITCRNVGGDADAGSYVECGDIGGDVDAGSYVHCGDVHGSVDAGSYVQCGDVSGDVDAGNDVTCRSVEGDVDAGGRVIIGK